MASQALAECPARQFVMRDPDGAAQLGENQPAHSTPIKPMNQCRSAWQLGALAGLRRVPVLPIVPVHSFETPIFA